MTSRWSDLAPCQAAALRVALVALSVVLLLPACGVLASQARGAPANAASGQLWSGAGHAQHHGGAVSEGYCASVGTAAAAERPLAAERGALPAPTPAAPPYPVATSFLPRPAAAPHPPPFKVSFYLRSTRILR